jgi:hypothetical protein
VNNGVQSAGNDTITVTGSGASYVFGDYGIIDGVWCGGVQFQRYR